MTQPEQSNIHVQVECRLCGGVAGNRTGWPICKGCWDSGAYENWLWREYGRLLPEGAGDELREVVRALNMIRGRPITEHDARARGVDVRLALAPRRGR